MNKTMIRLGGVTAVFGGIYLLLMAVFQAFINGDIENYPIVSQTIALLPILLLLGAAGLFTLANGRRGVQIGALIIALGAILMTISFALMTWFDNENGWTPMYFGMMIMPVGLLIFGATNWRAEILSRWNKAPLIFGVVTTFLIFFGTLDLFMEQQSEYLFAIFLLLLAIGWIAIGVGMVLGGSDFNNGSVELVKPGV